MNNEFDPRTFSSNISFTGNPAVDDIIAFVLFIGVIAVIVGGIEAWNNMHLMSYCFKVVAVLALILFLVKIC